jgi:hypothetical protein
MAMNQFQYRVPQQVASRNGYAPSSLEQLQMSPATPVGRENLMKLSTGVALAGGAAWAFLSMPSTSKKNKTALGVLGGGLAASALLSVVDAFL